MTIVEFLTARLDEDAQEAERVDPVDLPDWRLQSSANNQGRVDLLLIHPARVLADVAAKRAILELHGGGHECSTYDHRGEIDNCTWVMDGGCTTVLLLAQPFAGHPDFDPAWAVAP